MLLISNYCDLKKSIDASSKCSSNEDESDEDFLDARPKWLIFTCGSRTYTPHQLGFKKINPITFNGRIDPGPTLKERIEEYKRRRQLERTGDADPGVNWQDYSRVANQFDEVNINKAAYLSNSLKI